MSSIDERVVGMKFDNGQFERGVHTTIGSLDKLNSSLKLEGAAKGLKDISAAAGRFTLDHIGSAVDSIAHRFSAMGIVATTALVNITHQALAAGTQIVKSLTIDPIRAGLAEYEDKLTSIKTILANTSKQGTTLTDVTKALDELNRYSDQTIYSFGEMTRSVKMFTTAGVDLETSTASIKGLSNVAAVTGTNSTDAARAMYQMSLALSSGSVRLQDWLSLESAGGMAGKLFQNSLIETAKVHGVNVDAMIKKSGSFRNTLEKGWLTTEVLTETLSKFTGDLSNQQLKALGYTDAQIVSIQKLAKQALSSAQDVKTLSALFDTLKEAAGSGWAQTWEILFGNVDEATKLWSGLSDTIGGFLKQSADSRNKLLSDWKELGGRTALIDGIKNAFNALMAILKPIKDAFREIFPAKTAQDLFTLTAQFRNFTAGLKIGSETADRIKRIFAGFFAVLGIGWDIVKGVAGVIGRLIGVATKGSGGFMEFAASIGDWLVRLREATKSGEGLKNFFQKLGDILVKPVEMVGKLGDYLLALFKGSEGGSGKLASAWQTISNSVKDAWASVKPFIDKVGAFFKNIGTSIKNAASGLDLGDILGIVATGSLAGIATSIGLLLKKVFGMFGGSSGGGIMDQIGDMVDQVTDSFQSLQNTLRATTLLQIAAAIGVMTLSVVALSKVDAVGLTAALTAMTVMFAQLGGALFLMEKYLSEKDIAKMYAIAGAMIVLGIAVRLLASSVKTLAELSWDELARGLFGVTILIGALVVATQNMPNDKKMISSGIALVILAAAVKLLASAVTDLSGLSWDEMARGLTGVAGILLALGLFTKFSDADKGGLSSGLGLLLLATGVLLLSKAITDIAKLSWEQIAKGLAGVAGALVLIVGTMDLLPPTAVASGAGILIVSLGLVSIGNALEKVGNLSWEQIAKGLVGLLGALTIISAALYVIPPTAPLGAAGVLLVAMSLAKVGDFLERMSEMSWEEIGKAMTALAGSLFIIAGALLIMPSAIPGALALLIVAGALTILQPILQAFGEMSWEEIGKAFVVLAGVFLTLGVAALVLTPVVPIIIALAASILLLGAGMLLAGVGILAFAAGLTLLSMLGVETANNIVKMVGTLLELIPMVMQKIGEGIIAFAQVIAKGGPAITGALTTVLLSLIEAINKVAPKIIETLFKLLTLMLAKLMDFIPKMVQAGLKILLGILSGIADNIYKIVTVAVKIITEFLRGIGDNIGKITKAAADLIIKFVNALADTIEDKSEEMGKAGGRLAGAIIKGMVKGLGAGASEVASAAKEAAKAALDAAKNFLGINSPSKEFMYVGEGTNEGFALGIKRSVKLVTNATKKVGKTALTTLRESLAGLSTLVSGDVDLNPTITPVLDLSSVRKDSSQIGALLSSNPIAVGSSYSAASAASNGYESNRDAQNEQQSLATHAESFSFTQNNYSPKALSSADIYRQTNNQLSVAKGALTKKNA